jgi:hypothetical protein
MEVVLNRCPQCGRAPRPDVVLFGESLPEGEWYKAALAVNALQPGKDVMVVIGTTGGLALNRGRAPVLQDESVSLSFFRFGVPCGVSAGAGYRAGGQDH